MSYIGNTPGVSSQRVVLEEVISGSPKSAFVPIGGYIKGYVDVLVNGVEIDTSDFTATDGITVNLVSAAAIGDTVKIKAWLPRGLSDGYLKSEADAKFVNYYNGKAGVGTTTPSKLFVVSNNGADGIEFSPNDASTSNLNRILSYNRSTGAYTPLVIQGSALKLFTKGGSADESFSVDSSGNINAVGNITLDNGAADGAQLVLKSLGFSDWNIDNYSGRLRAYYGSTEMFTVLASGNTGFGTSAPWKQIQAGGSSYNADLIAIGPDGVRGTMLLGGNTNAGSGSSWITFGDDASSAGGGGGSQIKASGTGTLQFLTRNGSGLIPRLQIANDGSQSSVIPGGTTLYPVYGCRAWVSFNGNQSAGANASIHGSGGVSSVYKSAGSQYQVNFNFTMPDTVYGMAGGGDRTSGVRSTNVCFNGGSPRFTTYCLLYMADAASSANPDIATVMFFR